MEEQHRTKPQSLCWLADPAKQAGSVDSEIKAYNHHVQRGFRNHSSQPPCPNWQYAGWEVAKRSCT